MAYLIKCRCCGGSVSSEAVPPCPHCKDPYITHERFINEIDREIEAYRRQEKNNKKEQQKEQWKEKGLCTSCGGICQLRTGIADNKWETRFSYLECDSCGTKFGYIPEKVLQF